MSKQASKRGRGKSAGDASKPQGRIRSSTSIFAKGRKIPIVRSLESGEHVKIEFDDKGKDLIATLITPQEASAFISRQNPPKVVPITNKPGWVILYTWDASRNQYDQGVVMPIGDPRLP